MLILVTVSPRRAIVVSLTLGKGWHAIEETGDGRLLGYLYQHGVREFGPAPHRACHAFMAEHSPRVPVEALHSNGKASPFT